MFRLNSGRLPTLTIWNSAGPDVEASCPFLMLKVCPLEPSAVTAVFWFWFTCLLVSVLSPVLGSNLPGWPCRLVGRGRNCIFMFWLASEPVSNAGPACMPGCPAVPVNWLPKPPGIPLKEPPWNLPPDKKDSQIRKRIIPYDMKSSVFHQPVAQLSNTLYLDFEELSIFSIKGNYKKTRTHRQMNT